jgi:hypothetical protein
VSSIPIAGPGPDTPWPNFFAIFRKIFTDSSRKSAFYQFGRYLRPAIGIMSSLLDIENLRIDSLQAEGFTSLKEGTEVPSNCSLVKRKRKRNPNDKRTGWQFKQPAVRAKIHIWNEAQKRRARDNALARHNRNRDALFAKLDAGARPSHVESRDERGRIKRSYQRWVSIEGLEGQRQSGIRRARENALKRKAPTAGLTGLEEYDNGFFRSLAEAETAALLTLAGIDYRYAETSAAQPAKSATINLQPTFRQDDFHIDVGAKKYKIQLKGSGALFKRFEKLIGPIENERQFRRFRSDLLNLINEDVINQLELSLGLDVREQLLCSTTSLFSWIRDVDNLPASESIEKLYRRESKRFRRYLYQFAFSVFPREMRVIDRAVELFKAVPESELTDVPELIVDFYIECLSYAMDELGYDNHIRSIHRDFYRWRKNAKALRSLLPKRFQPTMPKPKIQTRKT